MPTGSEPARALFGDPGFPHTDDMSLEDLTQEAPMPTMRTETTENTQLNRRDRRMAGKKSQSGGKIPDRVRFGVVPNARQHAFRRKG